MTLRRTLIGVFLALAAAASTSGQTPYEPGAENLKSRQWFQDSKFGLFVHWGVYILLSDGEWVMNNRRIPAADYEKLPRPDAAARYRERLASLDS